MLTMYLISGILGAFLMYAGDMLLYGTTTKFPRSIEGDFAKIKFLLQRSSSRRIFIGGIIGPLAATLYILGLLHIPTLALQQYRSHAWILFALFALSYVFGGAFHMAWIFLGDAAKMDDDKQWYSIQVRFSQFKPIIFGFLSLSALLLSILILIGGLGISPGYTCITPMVLILLLPILRKIPQPIGIWIWGGWTNLVFVIYYTVLLLTLT